MLVGLPGLPLPFEAAPGGSTLSENREQLLGF